MTNHPNRSKFEVTGGLSKSQFRNKLYAKSPFDLCTDEDNAYRDGVDETLDLLWEYMFSK